MGIQKWGAMKIDCGFWDKNREYKEDIQEVEMLSVKDLNEIELIKGQNEGLKKQNKELQEGIKKYAAINEQETKDYAELKAENERLKSKIKDLQIRKDRYYLKGLEQERQISDYITLFQEIKAIVCGNYEIIDPQGRKDILKLINKTEIK